MPAVWTLRSAGHGVVPARAAFGAGCLEAYFTHTRMYQYWYNYARANYAPSFDPPAKLVGFMTKQKAWVRSKLAAAALTTNTLTTNTTAATTATPSVADSGRAPAPPPATEAKFWTGMGLLMAQFDGLASGFATYESTLLLFFPSRPRCNCRKNTNRGRTLGTLC